MEFYLQIKEVAWWAMTGSNRRHLRCKRSSPPPVSGNINSRTLLKEVARAGSPASAGSHRFIEPLCTSLRWCITTALIALPLAASAGGLAGPGYDGGSMFDEVTNHTESGLGGSIPWHLYDLPETWAEDRPIVPEVPVALPNQPETPERPDTPRQESPETPAPVPLPASIWLLAGALLILRRWAR